VCPLDLKNSMNAVRISLPDMYFGTGNPSLKR
jgi:hypothetical protein